MYILSNFLSRAYFLVVLKELDGAFRRHWSILPRIDAIVGTGGLLIFKKIETFYEIYEKNILSEFHQEYQK